MTLMRGDQCGRTAWSGRIGARGDEGITTMGISDRLWRRASFDRSTRIRVGIALTAVGALAAAALAGGGSASAAGKPDLAAGRVTPDVAAAPLSVDGYQFVELGSHKNRAYNLLLGINNHGRIAGTYGSGGGGQASKGYTINPPYGQGDIKSENFPHSAQTEVEGLNDTNVQVGYYSTQNKTSGIDNSFGWYFNGSFHKVVYPTGNNAKPIQDQLDGVNNHDVAVGYYENGSGRFRGYTYSIKTGKFALVTEPGAPTGGSAPSLSAYGINNAGDVVGSYTTATGALEGFIKLAGGAFRTIAVGGAKETFAFGVNDSDTVVGGYLDDSTGVGIFHGFIWRPGANKTSIFKTAADDPSATAVSIIAGVNDENDVVGYYEDGHGFHGFLAYPVF
jgi:hypothetical protein